MENNHLQFVVSAVGAGAAKGDNQYESQLITN
jgi:hypothetical protein